MASELDQPITVEFFHDALSAWAFPFSRRLRAFVAKHPNVTVHQRVYPMAQSPEFFSNLFPDPVAAKQEVVMEHWLEAKEIEADERINCELMMERDFPYPYSIPNSLGAKAAEILGGQPAHWDFFDRVQTAHLSECRNIADYEVLTDCAADIGLDSKQWLDLVHGDQAKQMVRNDMLAAQRYGILRNPALVAQQSFQLPGECRSIMGFRISEEALQRWYDDVQRRLKLSYLVLGE